MPQTKGLRRRSEFQRVFREGRVCRGGEVELFVAERGDEQPARFGFAAGRGVGGAVRRNRMRRRMREVAARAQVRPGVDVVVRVRAELGFAQLNEEVRRCLKKIGAAP